MSIMRWDPFSGLSRLHDEIDRMFEDFFPGRRAVAREPMWRAPSVDVEDTDNAVVVRAEVPGVKKEDLDIEITDHTISIKAEAREEKEKKEGRYYRHERSWGMFQRVIPLPVEIKAKEAKASLKEGLLEVTLPKAAPEQKAEAVKIKPE